MEAGGAGEVHLRGDGRVRKVEVTREGRGETPELHAVCQCHYSGAPAGGGPPFFSTRAEEVTAPVLLTAGRVGGREEGLCVGLTGMRPGERCRLWVSWELAFGERGSASNPVVPPRTDIVYDVELLSWEPPEERPKSEMLFEERCEAAERRRLRGNAQFRDSDLRGALDEYEAALDYVDDELMMQLHGRHVDAANAVRIPALLNAAAVHTALGDPQSALDCTKVVLLEDPRNAKAYFRQGVAHRSRGELEAATASLQRADGLQPGDPSVRKELQKVKQAQRQERAAVGHLYKDVFKKAGRGAAGDNAVLAKSTPREGVPPCSTGLIGVLVDQLSALLLAIRLLCARLLGTRHASAPSKKA